MFWGLYGELLCGMGSLAIFVGLGVSCWFAGDCGASYSLSRNRYLSLNCSMNNPSWKMHRNRLSRDKSLKCANIVMEDSGTTDQMYWLNFSCSCSERSFPLSLLTLPTANLITEFGDVSASSQLLIVIGSNNLDCEMTWGGSNAGLRPFYRKN